MMYTIVDTRPGHGDLPIFFYNRYGTPTVPLHFTKEGAEKVCKDLNRPDSRWLGAGYFKVIPFRGEFEQNVDRARWVTQVFD